MPKKFTGENSKAVASKAQKEAVKSERREKDAKAKEDLNWAEDDKNVIKKQQRKFKEEEERRRNKAAEKKRENAKLYEAEMSKLQTGGAASAKAGARKPNTPKVTMATLEARRQEDLRRRAEQQREEEERSAKIEIPSGEIEENVNRVNADSAIATNVDDAIRALASLDAEDQIDRHPEKRMRAAYNAFELKRLPELKRKNPTLRLSQLKEILHKEWQKSPENPLRQQKV